MIVPNATLRAGRPASRRTRRTRGAANPFTVIRNILLWQGSAAFRMRRYLLVFGLPLLGLWTAVAAYIILTPKTYVSEMTLNLPGAASSSNVSLDSIGQASTSSGNPFSSAAMSPKVIYKSIAEGAHVRGLAARIVGKKGMLAMPRIKLIDETAIMQFSVTAGCPEAAQHEGEALLHALQQYLDILRKDEVERRAKSVKESLKEVSRNLAEARSKLLAYQAQSDIISPEQFNAQVANAEGMRQKRAELRAEQRRTASEAESLGALLGISPADATLALKVQGDPRFSSLYAELAVATTDETSSRSKWGARHPRVVAAAARTAAARRAVAAMAAKQGGKRGSRIVSDLLLSDSRDRAELFRRLVETAGAAAGLEGQIASIEETLRASEIDLRVQGQQAARLEDLQRDHKIAEAVFSSALARVDTNRQDIYASYPLLQVLTEPSLPDKAVSPKPLFAVAGALLATLFILLALGLAWIRQPLLQKLLKNT